MKLSKRKLSLAMANKSMLQRDLAKKSGLSYPSISKAIQELDLSTRTVGQIANALDVRVEDLVLDQDKE